MCHVGEWEATNVVFAMTCCVSSNSAYWGERSEVPSIDDVAGISLLGAQSRRMTSANEGTQQNIKLFHPVYKHALRCRD